MNNIRLVKDVESIDTVEYTVMRKGNMECSFKCARKPTPAFDEANLIYCLNGKVFHRRYVDGSWSKPANLKLRYTHHNEVQIAIPAINVFTVWIGKVKYKYTLNYAGVVSTIRESTDKTM